MRVHSLGHVDAPGTKIALKNPAGEIVRLADVPALEAPVDLYPRSWEIIFNVYDIPDLKGYTVEIDPYRELQEITRENNSVTL